MLALSLQEQIYASEGSSNNQARQESQRQPSGQKYFSKVKVTIILEN
jgi:hypothetical protein